MASYTFRSFTRAQLIAALKDLRITTVNLKDVKDHLPSTSVEAEQAALADYAAAGDAYVATPTTYAGQSAYEVTQSGQQGYAYVTNSATPTLAGTRLPALHPPGPPSR